MKPLFIKDLTVKLIKNKVIGFKYPIIIEQRTKNIIQFTFAASDNGGNYVEIANNKMLLKEIKLNTVYIRHTKKIINFLIYILIPNKEFNYKKHIIWGDVQGNFRIINKNKKNIKILENRIKNKK